MSTFELFATRTGARCPRLRARAGEHPRGPLMWARPEPAVGPGDRDGHPTEIGPLSPEAGELHSRMTHRQREILRLRPHMPAKEIAETLGVSKTLAFDELVQLRALFGARDDVQLVLRARDHGLI